MRRSWCMAYTCFLLLLLAGLPACAPASGKELVEKECTRCHTLAPIQAAHKSAQEWEYTVGRMIGMGARLNDRQAERVVAYLSEQYGVKP